MIGSYIKTSGRNLMRNKLFSSINIVGLAISMSVGLLLIAFLHDMISYDRFNEKGNRIYRITTLRTAGRENQSTFASTSVKAGKLIQERVSGVEDAAIICREFSGDAKIGDNTVPLSGLYAGPATLRIFTLPMLKGDPATALQHPYSIVLTETSAKKLFGDEDALNKTILFDTLTYQVTGVIKDVPFFSHIRFESLVSLSTMEVQSRDDKYFSTWDNIWLNYVYVLLRDDANVSDVQAQINTICAEENKADDNIQIQLSILPLYDIMLGDDLSNPIGPTMPALTVWVVSGLALLVILSACFNYTNLSIARSMRRFKEVGLRKAIGAGRSQVRLQFLAEAVLVSLAALLLSFVIFVILRLQFIDIAPGLLNLVKLDVTAPMVAAFVGFSVAVGALAGFLPAIFFAKVNIIHALRDVSSAKVFTRLSLRRVLVVVQYTVTVIFITTTIIGYTQYKSILAFDLGFSTENIVNISLQGNKPDGLVNQLKSLPDVDGVSRSRIITSVGNYWSDYLKYKDSRDSTIVMYNSVDENYIPVHGHKLIAGQNFIARPTTNDAATEVIVSEKVLKRFNIGGNDPSKAIGEQIIMGKKKVTIVGVMRDFHYGKVNNNIEPVVFKYLIPGETAGLVNVRITTGDPLTAMAKIEQAWKAIDRVHPLKARFYDDAIQAAYQEFSVLIKVIGFLSFLAISIASMGLFGMVVFTTETRIKEIGIRKVLGASSGNLVFLLGRGFLFLLTISALIALPATYLFFENVVLPNFPFHNPIGIAELFGGVLGVLLIAFVMIGSQTMKAARTNPAEVLKSE